MFAVALLLFGFDLSLHLAYEEDDNLCKDRLNELLGDLML